METYWYYYVLLWTMMWWMICSRSKISIFAKKVYFIIVYIPLSLIVGFRHWSTSEDTLEYLIKFHALSDAPLDGFMVKRFEIGFVLLNKFVNGFSDNGQLVLIIGAFITILGYGLFFYKYSPNFYLSSVIFVGFFFYFQTFVIVRQCLAMMIVSWGMASLWSGNRLRFVILTLVATTMHATALIFLPAVLLYPLSFRKSLLIISIVLVLFFVIDYYGITVLRVIMPESSKYLKYLGWKYIKEGQIGLSVLRLMMCAILGLYGWFVYSRNYKNQYCLEDAKSQCLLWSVLAILIVIFIGIMESRLPLLHRIDAYFFSFICLLIPRLVSFLNYKSRIISNYLLCVLSIIYLGRSMSISSNFSEYRFFF